MRDNYTALTHGRSLLKSAVQRAEEFCHAPADTTENSIIAVQSVYGYFIPMRLLNPLLFLFISIPLGRPLTRGEDAAWPQFRGSKGGIANSSTAPTSFSPEKALWQTEVPPGHSSPCISGSSIFLTAVKRASGEVETLCIGRQSGAIRWRRGIKPEKLEATHKINNPAAPTPATDGKALVAYFGSLGLVAYDFDGKELWRTPLPKPQVRFGYGSGTSPIIVKDRVILAMELGGDSYLGAFDLGTGKEIWRAPRPLYNSTWATPIHWREGEADRIGVVSAGRFDAYAWKDGKELWWVDGIGNQVCATPVEENGILYITSAGVFAERATITIPESFEKMQEYDKNKDGVLQFTEIPSTVMFVRRGSSDGAGDMSLPSMLKMMGQNKEATFTKEQWEGIRKQLIDFQQSALNQTSVMAVRAGGMGDVTKSHVLWNESRGVPEIPSPLLANGRVYLIKNGGVLSCREAKTGKLLFEERVGSTGGYYASPVAAGENIYVASDTGAITVLRASDKLEVISRNSLGERVQASPAIVDSTLYIRGEKHLWAFK